MITFNQTINRRNIWLNSSITCPYLRLRPSPIAKEPRYPWWPDRSNATNGPAGNADLRDGGRSASNSPGTLRDSTGNTWAFSCQYPSISAVLRCLCCRGENKMIIRQMWTCFFFPNFRRVKNLTMSEANPWLFSRTLEKETGRGVFSLCCVSFL